MHRLLEHVAPIIGKLKSPTCPSPNESQYSRSSHVSECACAVPLATKCATRQDVHATRRRDARGKLVGSLSCSAFERVGRRDPLERFSMAGASPSEIRVVRDQLRRFDRAHFSRTERDSRNQDDDSRNSSRPRPPRDSNGELATRGPPRLLAMSSRFFFFFFLEGGEAGSAEERGCFKRETRGD